MSLVDPTHGLANPYARNDGAGCSTRVAGRALAVGALGLGAVAVFTGTGFADEGPPAEDTASEVTSDEVAPETEEGQDAPAEDAEEQPAAEGEVLQFASGTDAPVDAEDLMFYSGVADTPDGVTGGRGTDPGQDVAEPLTGTATEMVPQVPYEEHRPGPTDQQGERPDAQVEQDRIAQWEANGGPVGPGGLPPGPPTDPNWEFTDPGRHYDPIIGGWVLGPDPTDTAQDETPREPDAQPGTTTDDTPGQAPGGEAASGSDLPPGPPTDPNWEFTDPGRHYDATIGGWVLGPDPTDTAQDESPREPDALGEAAAEEVPVESATEAPDPGAADDRGEDETLGGATWATVPAVPGVGGRSEWTGPGEPSGPRLVGERLAQRQERLAERQERLAERQDRLVQRQERLAQRQEQRAAGRGGVLLTDPDAAPDVSPALAEAGPGGGDLFPGYSAGSLGGGYLFPGPTSWSHPGGSGS